MSWSDAEMGFNGTHMQVIRVASNAEWGDIVNIITPRGIVQVYVSPKGRSTRIFWNNEELNKANTL